MRPNFLLLVHVQIVDPHTRKHRSSSLNIGLLACTDPGGQGRMLRFESDTDIDCGENVCDMCRNTAGQFSSRGKDK